jgi:hypothetical protein
VLYSDGGILCNYPIHFFDTDTVLGIHLGKRGKITNMYEYFKFPKYMRMLETILKTFFHTLSITMNAHEKLLLKGLSVREVEIDTMDVGLLSFDMGDEQKAQSIVVGYQAALEFISDPKLKVL